MATVTIVNRKKLLPPESILRFQGGNTSITISAQSYDTALDGSASNDPDGNIATYIWERKLDAGLWQQIGSTAFNTYTNTVAITGTYQYRLKAIDNDNLSSYSNIITLNFTKLSSVAPEANINDSTITNYDAMNSGEVYQLDASLSTSGEVGTSFVSVNWTVLSPSGMNGKIKYLNQFKATFNPTVAGTYTIELEVVSSNGLSDTALLIITVY